jgi:rRNA small subunit pseudouridine methyltransferase Nep1
VAKQILIIEDASLQLLPVELRKSKDAKSVERLFGVKPEHQILDSNFHRLEFLQKKNTLFSKSGRPDVVHFALLDATSTPLFQGGKLQVYIHTLEDVTIEVKRETRLPRTLPRFCGVMSKLLSGRYGPAEEQLFSIKGSQTFNELLVQLGINQAIALSRIGRLTDLNDYVQRILISNDIIAWIVGGFSIGHFEDETLEASNELISISKGSLPAHVVTARLCYEIERRT